MLYYNHIRIQEGISLETIRRKPGRIPGILGARMYLFFGFLWLVMEGFTKSPQRNHLNPKPCGLRKVKKNLRLKVYRCYNITSVSLGLPVLGFKHLGSIRPRFSNLENVSRGKPSCIKTPRPFTHPEMASSFCFLVIVFWCFGCMHVHGVLAVQQR